MAGHPVEPGRARPAEGSEGAARRAGAYSLSRILGFDRSGAPPPQTLSGAPLRPWTIPNAIGFVRLALIPVFLVVALSTSDGVDALSATLFALIGWGDYADGLAARITRQYSRLGTLMDPVSDRLLVIAGVVVCWRFELLPRWALAVLIGRELAMLVLGRYAVKRGVEVQINWPGRLSVVPIMGALFLAMTGLQALPEVLLYLGVAMALLASVLYFTYGLTELRRRPRPH